MIVSALYCSNCHQVIYSRAHHDFNECKCKDLAIDGGTQYTKCSWNPDKEPPKAFTLDIGNVSKTALYEDWNHGEDDYGRIQLEPIYFDHEVSKFRLKHAKNVPAAKKAMQDALSQIIEDKAVVILGPNELWAGM